jgi:hypothetical protein
MKTRNGFVSNSSASSFCIYGFELEDGLNIDSFADFKKKHPDLFLKRIEEAIKSLNDYHECYREFLDMLKRVDDLTDEEQDILYDEIRGDLEFYFRFILDDEGVLEIFDGYEGENIFIGRAWKNIKDNETGLQFKQSVGEAVHKLYGSSIKCETHEEAWGQ